MQIISYRTPIVRPQDDLFELLDSQLPQLSESTVVAVTSKIIGLCEGRVRAKTTEDKREKHALVRQEADYYLDPQQSKYDLMLTVKNNILAVNAGIDESNADGQYVYWPADPQAAANAIWTWLRDKRQVNQVGVIITDSKTTPLLWGVTGVAIAHAGFKALHDLIGQPDLFGRLLKMEKVNVAQGLATAAVLVMGEAAEQTPLATITDIPGIEWQDRIPTGEELAALRIELADDAYAPILEKAHWQTGGRGKQ
jgi:putative folate metabolism gamma-glutamate ligase